MPKQSEIPRATTPLPSSAIFRRNVFFFTSGASTSLFCFLGEELRLRHGTSSGSLQTLDVRNVGLAAPHVSECLPAMSVCRRSLGLKLFFNAQKQDLMFMASSKLRGLSTLRARNKMRRITKFSFRPLQGNSAVVIACLFVGLDLQTTKILIE